MPLSAAQAASVRAKQAMGKRLDTRLSEEDRQALEEVFRKSADWRARERAKTLLLLSQPMLSREVALVQELNICTVRETWRHWLKEGMDCLNDKPRSGAPRKLDEAAIERLVQWAREEPLSGPELLQRHTQAQGTAVHVETLIRNLKEQGLVWKRTRHSLKKNEMPPPLSKPAKNSKR
jgi:transposase